MLVTFVVLYLLVTIGIGLIAARRVHGAKDYLVAGRSLRRPGPERAQRRRGRGAVLVGVRDEYVGQRPLGHNEQPIAHRSAAANWYVAPLLSLLTAPVSS